MIFAWLIIINIKLLVVKFNTLFKTSTMTNHTGSLGKMDISFITRLSLIIPGHRPKKTPRKKLFLYIVLSG